MTFKFYSLGFAGVLFRRSFCGMLCIALLAGSTPKPILGASPNESELNTEFVKKTRDLAQLAIDWGVFQEGGQLSSMIQYLAPQFYQLHHVRLFQLKTANLQEPGQSPKHSLDLPYEDVRMTDQLWKEIEVLYNKVFFKSRDLIRELGIRRSEQYAALLAVIGELKTQADKLFHLEIDRSLRLETRHLIRYADDIGIFSGGSAFHDLVSLQAPLFYESHYSKIRAYQSPSGELTDGAIQELKQLVRTVRDRSELARVFPVLAHRHDYPAFLSRIEAVYREAVKVNRNASLRPSCDGGLGDLAAVSPI